MSTIKRKLRSFKPLVFTVNLTAIGKTHADVEDIVCVVKNQESDSDSEALRMTTMADGNSIDANNKILIPWAYDDYDGFRVGGKYKLGVFCKFTGDPVFDEDVKQIFDLTLIQDMVHDE